MLPKVFCITPNDHAYPNLLKEVRDYPKKLFVRGNITNEMFENCVAVVGSRRMSVYGKKCVKSILSGLNPGVTIVSGFMTGIDAESHSVAVDVGLKTVAVMPCGINFIHPENQADLYEKILMSGGAIISEYAEDRRPQLWTYPRRNRIVAGLSRCTVVIEAGIKSGSLLTAGIANDLGRKVFAVPGSIFSDTHEGTLHLIKRFANILTSGFEINKFLGLESFECERDNTSSLKFLPVRDSIYSALRSEGLTFDELSCAVCSSPEVLATELTYMTIDGTIIEKEGKFYVG